VNESAKKEEVYQTTNKDKVAQKAFFTSCWCWR